MMKVEYSDCLQWHLTIFNSTYVSVTGGWLGSQEASERKVCNDKN